MIATAECSNSQIHHEFETLLPELTSRLRYRFFEHGPELQAEFVAEGVALSWQAFASASRRGKTVTPGNLAWYTSKAVLCGRRLAGARSSDALSDRPLARKRVGTHVSLFEVGEDARTFYCVFGDRRWRWPVIDIIATKLDWQSFLSRCDHRDQEIVKMKLAGCMQTEIAVELDLSPAFICQRLRALRQRWDARAAA